MLHGCETRDGEIIQQAYECRFWAIRRQQCVRQRLSLDAGACESSSKALLHIRDSFRAPEDENSPSEHQTLHLLPKKVLHFLSYRRRARRTVQSMNQSLMSRCKA